MGRLDIKIKRGTQIVVEYADGSTVEYKTITDIDIDSLYDTIGRLEQLGAEREARSQMLPCITGTANGCECFGRGRPCYGCSTTGADHAGGSHRGVSPADS